MAQKITTMKSNAQAMFDIYFPIGYVYEQLPTDINERVPLNPNEMWNNDDVHSVWVELDYAGAFFRSEGGNALEFGSGKQDEGLPNIRASVSCASEGLFNGRGTISTSGAFSVSGSNKYCGGDNGDGGRPNALNFNASTSNAIYGKSDHVTVENYTYKKWIRIE